jgi:hypothetical protein
MATDADLTSATHRQPEHGVHANQRWRRARAHQAARASARAERHGSAPGVVPPCNAMARAALSTFALALRMRSVFARAQIMLPRPWDSPGVLCSGVSPKECRDARAGLAGGRGDWRRRAGEAKGRGRPVSCPVSMSFEEARGLPQPAAAGAESSPASSSVDSAASARRIAGPLRDGAGNNRACLRIYTRAVARKKGCLGWAEKTGASARKRDGRSAAALACVSVQHRAMPRKHQLAARARAG